MTKIEMRKEIKRLKKWTGREGEFEHSVSSVQGILESELSPVYLIGLSSWYGHIGNLLILEGNPTGWEHLRHSYDCDSLGIRITAAYQEIGRYRNAISEEVAIWLTFAIAFRLDLFATWLGDRIIASLEEKVDNYRIGPRGSAYFFAFIQFYALWQKKKFNIKDHFNEPLGVYQEILDGWQDEKRYVKACLKACDYHVKRMHDDNGYSEFLGAPQDLLPVEMLMIRRIREDHGLPNPEIDHPLMQTPLGQAPRTLPEVKDELLERVIAKARKELKHFPDF